MDYQWLTDTYIAHRGLFDNKTIPENSLIAFQRAVDNGFGIELDVQMTADGHLVVFHDDDMERMTGIKGDIRKTDFATVSSLTLINTEHKIPTFDQFLNLVDGKVPLVIEIKTHDNIGGVEQKVLDRLRQYKGKFCIESFNPFIVRWFKVHAPDIIRGQLSESFENTPLPRFQRWLLKNLKFCKWNGSQFIAYDVRIVDKVKAVKKWRKKVPVVVWTVKSQAQHDEYRKYYDNMIFDSFVPTRDDKIAK